MNLLRYNTVLFDLDGTLIDTNELILVSFLNVLNAHFPGKYARQDLIPHMGKTLHEQMELFGGLEKRDELVDAYRVHNEEIHDEWIREFPHVRETLAELKELGITMGVVTTKQRKTAEMGAAACGVSPYMSTFVTFQDTEKHKPSPDPVLKALSDLGADPSKTLMVGDTQFDIQAGHNAGVHSAGVAWSLKGAEFLAQFKPEYILQDMRDLIAVVKGEK